jgi:Uma2 family endonuclease
VVPAPLPRHQIVRILLVEMLREYAKAHGGLALDSPIDIVFSDHDVLQPDVLYFTPSRAHLVDLDRVIRDAPDLCIEVLSPSTAATDRGKKMQMFARYGVGEYWIVDPRSERIEVYELVNGAYALHATSMGDAEVRSATLPGHTFIARPVFP